MILPESFELEISNVEFWFPVHQPKKPLNNKEESAGRACPGTNSTQLWLSDSFLRESKKDFSETIRFFFFQFIQEIEGTEKQKDFFPVFVWIRGTERYQMPFDLKALRLSVQFKKCA